MTIKSFTKLSLSALLLAAATHSAIAEISTEPEVVTLKDDKGNPVKTVSWSAFVNALNNPASITGTVDPESQVAKNLATAQTALDNATTNKTEKDDAVPVANQALIDAKDAADAAAKKVATSKAAYENAQHEIELSQAKLTPLQTELSAAQGDLSVAMSDNTKVPVDWLKTASDNAQAFKTAYDKEQTTGTNNLWYRTEKSSRSTWLIVSFTDPTGKDSNTWTKVDDVTYYTDVVENTEITVTKLKIFLGSDYTQTEDHCLVVDGFAAGSSKESVPGLCATALKTAINDGDYSYYANQAERTRLQNEVTRLKNEIATLNAIINNYTKVGEDGKTELTKLQEAYQNAQTDQTTKDRAVTEATTALSTAKEDAAAAETTLRNAQSDLTAAQAAYDAAAKEANANALLPYKDVTLAADVTANAAITTTFDGKIEGNGHVITLSGSDAPYLFETLKGHLVNVAVNGPIFNGTQPGATFNRVASWANNSGTYYDANGTVTSNIKTIGELGFIARDKFGADVETNTLTTLTDETKVYNITVYKTSTNAPQAYVNLKNGTFTNGRDLGITANTFVKSATADFDNIANVFYTDTDGANVCANVQIKDQNGLNFYCPVDITATAMTFDRTFKGNKGMNAVCLPFDLDPTDHESIDALCKYDVETADKFWFKKIENTIPANTPFLLYSKEGTSDFSLGEFHDITIKQTPAEQIVMYEGDAEDPSKSFGTLKKTGLEEFLGSYQAHKVYALKDNKFQATTGQAAFPAFRMIVTSEIVKSNGEHAPRRIAIVDEKGVEITDDIITGVENVAEETSSLNIAGGQGEIVITSDADYGKVEVYTMAGGVAAVADVMAGTTSVSLQKGIYIVMGKKVMVK